MIDLVDRLEVLTIVGNAFLNNKTMGQTLDAICNLDSFNEIQLDDAIMNCLASHLCRLVEVHCNTCEHCNEQGCEPNCEVKNSEWTMSYAESRRIVKCLIEHINLLKTYDNSAGLDNYGV